MTIRLLAFAQAADRLGFREREVQCEPADTPRQILTRVAGDFALAQTRVAVNCEYHDWDEPIGNASELALIPPVSGG